ncbi:MAG: TonB-dependent receptor plug domain-containing protein, partial [bacterium]|nr:TonB-dependent receptor plug domain-containing protein [bacterium]
MKFRKLTLLILFFYISLPILVFSKQQEDQIVVSATRLTELEKESPQNITIITQKEIEESGINNLAELIKVFSSMNVIDYGDSGKLKTLYFAGSNSPEILILINGIPVNSSGSGTFDLSSISMDLIERIEIIQGPNGNLHGTSGFSGTINIILKNKFHELPVQLKREFLKSNDSFKILTEAQVSENLFITTINESGKGSRLNSEYHQNSLNLLFNSSYINTDIKGNVFIGNQ